MHRFFDDILDEPLVREEFISFVPLENASAEKKSYSSKVSKVRGYI